MAQGKSQELRNKKAFFDYFVLERFEAGIVLEGCEVKSLRNGKGNLVDSFVRITNGEAYVNNMHISPYSHTHDKSIEPTRSRKLLLHKIQIEKIRSKVHEKGLTIIPVRLYFSRGKAKLEIAICKGKLKHDKRHDLKKKEHNREISRALRQRG